MAAPAENVHAVALVVGEAGVLIQGRPGAGKTALALELVDRTRSRGRFARLVADDRVLVEAHGGRVVARPHRLLAGLAEERGFGPLAHAHEPACVVRLLVEIAAPVERHAPPGPPAEVRAGVAEDAPHHAMLASLPLPLLRLPGGIDTGRAARLVLARLDAA